MILFASLPGLEHSKLNAATHDPAGSVDYPSTGTTDAYQRCEAMSSLSLGPYESVP